MAGTRTNSNSMTAILIVSLNNRKFGFRNQFLKLIGLPECDITFEDGTHSSIEYPEINNKEVDIVGRINGKISVLMEIKVGINETLQLSQKKGGEYDKVFNQHRDSIQKLIYLVPDNYSHFDELPDLATVIYWSKIQKIAEEFDSSELTDYIKNFVDLYIATNTVFTNGETYMILNRDAFVAAYGLSEKIITLGERFVEQNKYFNSSPQNDIYGVGVYFSLIKDEEANLFIGLNPSISKPDFFFSLAVPDSVYINEDVLKKNTSLINGEGEDRYKYFNFNDDKELELFLVADDENKQQDYFNKMVNNKLRNIGLLK